MFQTMKNQDGVPTIINPLLVAPSPRPRRQIALPAGERLTCPPLSKMPAIAAAAFSARSSQSRIRRRNPASKANDCRSHSTLSVAFVGSSTQIVPSTTRPIYDLTI
ncbi:hypothetical protein CN188_32830 [Sinorhizobium meliloti]|nr:hypothetical protein CN188_32830 [Sinorhizobium meliloti]RVN79283.1 hypothetical protein CN105_29820 [Sinorhizobium meliloti]RVO59262.1 hypothetical protein CN087_31960 [Sinorhizobium meliloti]